MTDRLAISDDPINRLVIEEDRRPDIIEKFVFSDKPIEQWLPGDQADIAQQILNSFENPEDERARISSAVMLTDMYNIPLDIAMTMQPEAMKRIFGEDLAPRSAEARLRRLAGGQALIGAPEKPEGWQRFVEFFKGAPSGRPVPLPQDAGRMEKVDRAIRTYVSMPLRTALKFLKGLELNSADVGWAMLKKIVPESAWDKQVKQMNLDQAMDWAFGHNPSGFSRALGDVAEFVGRLKTAKKIGEGTGILGELPKSIGVMGRALEAGKLGLISGTVEETTAVLSEMIDPDTDYGSEGATGVVKEGLVLAGFSLGKSLALEPVLKTKPGEAIIAQVDKYIARLSTKYPRLLDALRKEPSAKNLQKVKEALWRPVKDVETGIWRTSKIDFSKLSPAEQALTKHAARAIDTYHKRLWQAYTRSPTPDIVYSKNFQPASHEEARSTMRLLYSPSGAALVAQEPTGRPTARPPVADLAAKGVIIPPKPAGAKPGAIQPTEGKVITAYRTGDLKAKVPTPPDLQGLYFSDHKEMAEGFAKMGEVHKEAKEYKIQLNNPATEEIENQVAQELGVPSGLEEGYPGYGLPLYDEKSAKQVAEELQKRGYDGVVRSNGEIIVFNPQSVAPAIQPTEGEDIFDVIERDTKERKIWQDIKDNQQWVIEEEVLADILSGTSITFQNVKEKRIAFDANSKYTASFQSATTFGIPTRVVIRDQSGKYIGEASPFKSGIPGKLSKQKSQILRAITETMNEVAFNKENPVVTNFIFNEKQRHEGSKSVRSRAEEAEISRDPLVREALQKGIGELKKHEGEVWADEALDVVRGFVRSFPQMKKLVGTLGLAPPAPKQPTEGVKEKKAAIMLAREHETTGIQWGKKSRAKELTSEGFSPEQRRTYYQEVKRLQEKGINETERQELSQWRKEEGAKIPKESEVKYVPTEEERAATLTPDERIDEGLSIIETETGEKQNVRVEDIISVASNALQPHFGRPQRSGKSEAVYFEDEYKGKDRRIRIASHSVVYPETGDINIFVSIGAAPDADYVIPENVDSAQEVKQAILKVFKGEKWADEALAAGKGEGGVKEAAIADLGISDKDRTKRTKDIEKRIAEHPIYKIEQDAAEEIAQRLTVNQYVVGQSKIPGEIIDYMGKPGELGYKAYLKNFITTKDKKPSNETWDEAMDRIGEHPDMTKFIELLDQAVLAGKQTEGRFSEIAFEKALESRDPELELLDSIRYGLQSGLPISEINQNIREFAGDMGLTEGDVSDLIIPEYTNEQRTKAIKAARQKDKKLEVAQTQKQAREAEERHKRSAEIKRLQEEEKLRKMTEQARLQKRGELEKQATQIAQEKGLISPRKKRHPNFNRFAKAVTGITQTGKMSDEQLGHFVDMLDLLVTDRKGNAKIPTTKNLITAEFAEKIDKLQEIGAVEKIRPAWRVFQKIGLYHEVFEPAFEAEIASYEELRQFRNSFGDLKKEVGYNKETSKRIFRALDNPGSVKLNTKEQKVVDFAKRHFEDWADRLRLPLEQRRKNYVTHIFEKEIKRDLEDRYGPKLDPDLARALEFITPKTVFNPFLEKRLGKKIGLKEDIWAALEAYESKALKKFYYEPLIRRIRAYQKFLPPNSARYLRDFVTRITARPMVIDREVNQSLREAAEQIEKLPGGEELAKYLKSGNAAGLLAYNMTGLYYEAWLGLRPASAIKNLSQQGLVLAETGPVAFVRAITTTGSERARILVHSKVLRSRKLGYLPGVDQTFINGLESKRRRVTMAMFRLADRTNVSNAFIAGYFEAKANGLPDKWAYKRADEVAMKTQWLYSKMAGAQWTQSAPGRLLGTLTTWPENWAELMNDWIKARPSLVYADYSKETGQKIGAVNWFARRRSLWTYLALASLGMLIHKKTRFKALYYTGWTSISSLADIARGQLAGLEIPAIMADLTAGILLADEKRLKRAWNKIKGFIVITRELHDILTGEKDWINLFIYLEPKKKKGKKVPKITAD